MIMPSVMLPFVALLVRRIRFAAIVLAGLSAVLATAAAAADRWQTVPEQSRLGFIGTQGGQPFEGRFGRFDADIRFRADDLAASAVVVTIDMASATTGDPQKDGALPQAEWFHVRAFPQARFETVRFRHLGGDDYEADARLTLRDVTRDVVLPFTLVVEGAQATAEGRLVLDRTVYGVGQGAWASGQVVGTNVTVTIRLVARRPA
jgi:polyisoprenoid-binding protein YceI